EYRPRCRARRPLGPVPHRRRLARTSRWRFPRPAPPQVPLLRPPRPALIDEVGYLTYDSHAADLLFQVVNHRYERNSILLTTNKGFKDWNTVFPNATSIAALLDRLTHHAHVTLIQGTSYRVRESELEAAAR